MIRVLFVSHYTDLPIRAALSAVERQSWNHTEFLALVINSSPDSQKNHGIASSQQALQNGIILSPAQVKWSEIDIVIALTDGAVPYCSLLPGTPALVRWDLPTPPENNGGQEQLYLRDLAAQLGHHINELKQGGNLSGIVTLKRNSEMFLDHFSDGIIAHDTQRIITWFNSAAERITGYKREEVVGRDCHEVFPNNFCGAKCSFCQQVPSFDQVKYPLKIVNRDGHECRIEMNVVAIHDDQQNMQGVLANFRDITEVTTLRHQLRAQQSFHGIIGRDDKMRDVYDLIKDLSSSDCAVLILGESGTGKELVANAIHGESLRAGHPFVTVNCGALPEGILESELFGHVRGAFTGAVRDKKGRFELADKGTIFLDEAAELSPRMQVKLLRVLQEGTFEPVGSEKTVRVNVRVLSATNRNLRQMVRLGEFREDLFYRLCVVPLELPALRERRNDIPLLINHFVKKLSEELKSGIQDISDTALHHMIDYHWPGNVRELQNAIQYAFVKCKGNLIETENLPPRNSTNGIFAAKSVQPDTRQTYC